MFKELSWYLICDSYKKQNVVNFIFCFIILLVKEIQKVFPEIYQLSLFVHLTKLTNNGT